MLGAGELANVRVVMGRALARPTAAAQAAAMVRRIRAGATRASPLHCGWRGQGRSARRP